MEKPNPGSEQKDAKQQHGTRAEAGGAGPASPDTERPEAGTSSMGRMVGSAMSTTGQVSSGMVGGVTNIATDLVHGVGTIAGEAVSVVRDTANVALAGVGSIGETAVHTVTGLLSGLMLGLRDVGSAAVRGRATMGPEDETRHGEVQRRREEAVH